MIFERDVLNMLFHPEMDMTSVRLYSYREQVGRFPSGISGPSDVAAGRFLHPLLGGTCPHFGGCGTPLHPLLGVWYEFASIRCWENTNSSRRIKPLHPLLGECSFGYLIYANGMIDWILIMYLSWFDFWGSYSALLNFLCFWFSEQPPSSTKSDSSGERTFLYH